MDLSYRDERQTEERQSDETLITMMDDTSSSSQRWDADDIETQRERLIQNPKYPPKQSKDEAKTYLTTKLGYQEMMKRRIILIIKNPIFLLAILVLILVIIVNTAVSSDIDNELNEKMDQSGTKQSTKKPTDTKKQIVDKVNNLKPGNSPDSRNSRFDFSKNSNGALRASAGSVYNWVDSGADGSYVIQTEIGIVIKHIEFQTETLLASKQSIVNDKGELLHFENYWVSPDLKSILFSTEIEHGWRHSFFANYFVFNVALQSAIPLTTSISDKYIAGELGSGKISSALWSPTSDSVSWVRDNDLFVTRIKVVGEKLELEEIRITNDGSKDWINGICDWVYEEEVFNAHNAMWFSPDGTRLAYLKFNESEVPEYHYQLFETPHESYPREVSIKYPKPGYPNPVVTLHIAHTNTSKSISAHFVANQAFLDNDRLIVEVNWLTSETILVRVMNRVQDYQRIFLVSPKNVTTKGVEEGVEEEEVWVATMVRDEPSVDGAWFNMLHPVTVVGGGAYLELMEDAHGFTHIAYFKDVASGKPSAWLTSGDWEVVGILSVDMETEILYYSSTEVESTQRHLYSVHLNGFDKKKLTPPSGITYEPRVEMMTEKEWKAPKGGWFSKTKREAQIGADRQDSGKVEELSEENNKKNQEQKIVIGEKGYYEALFTPKSKYYVLKYLGPDVPFSIVLRTDNEWRKELVTNDNVREELLEYNAPKTKFITIKNDNGDNMNAKLLFPPNFDTSGKTKYPVFMQVYGGPNSQKVAQTYGFDFMTAIADASIISLTVDGRGTGFKGRKYRACVSTKLGSFEVEDQIAAAKWMGALPFVDKTKIAIWGWSYGGYMAAKVVEANSKIFSAAIAVAPVTDWRYYDTVYTERYMKTPKLNPDGYELSAVREMTGFMGTKFLLAHGISDDNVHFQNSADLVWHLTNEHVRDYRVQVYTDSDHNIASGGAHEEVYALIKNFLFDAFKIQQLR